MRSRHASAKAPQYQVIICVVPCVPDRYVLEQTTVCAQDVVGPGEHLLAACAAVLQPRLVLWEEVADHVLQAFLRQDRSNPPVPLPDLRCSQVSVKIADHQHRAPPGLLANGCNDVLYG